MILDEFSGQLSYQDIMHMTRKELEYMREHRKLLNKSKVPKDLNSLIK